MKNKQYYLTVLKFHTTYNPTKDQIKTRFSELSIIYHPDKSKEKNASDLYRDIIEARDFLLKELENPSQFSSPKSTTSSSSTYYTNQTYQKPSTIKFITGDFGYNTNSLYKNLYLYIGFETSAYTYFLVNFESKIKNLIGRTKWVKFSSNNLLLISSEFEIFNDLKNIVNQQVSHFHILSKITIADIEGNTSMQIFEFLKENRKVGFWVNRP